MSPFHPFVFFIISALLGIISSGADKHYNSVYSIVYIFKKESDIIMTIFWPDYYSGFKCKADKCLHTCCAGWEIGIDCNSVKRFKKDPDIACKMRDGGFILTDDGRCPFLRDDNLCEMIVKHGEDYICDICREHPRFYNRVNGRTEAGIGIVCEEACRLVICHDKDFELVAEDGSKTELPEYVKAVFDASKPLTQRLNEISGGKRAGSKLRAEIFDGMEVLDSKWTTLLKKIIDEPVSGEDADNEINSHPREYSNFAAYLLYRYNGAGRFAAEATYLIADLAVKGCGICEVARVFSGEVEYSDINIDEALETFK